MITCKREINEHELRRTNGGSDVTYQLDVNRVSRETMEEGLGQPDCAKTWLKFNVATITLILLAVGTVIGGAAGTVFGLLAAAVASAVLGVRYLHGVMNAYEEIGDDHLVYHIIENEGRTSVYEEIVHRAWIEKGRREDGNRLYHVVLNAHTDGIEIRGNAFHEYLHVLPEGRTWEELRLETFHDQYLHRNIPVGVNASIRASRLVGWVDAAEVNEDPYLPPRKSSYLPILAPADDRKPEKATNNVVKITKGRGRRKRTIPIKLLDALGNYMVEDANELTKAIESTSRDKQVLRAATDGGDARPSRQPEPGRTYVCERCGTDTDNETKTCDGCDDGGWRPG